MQHPEEGTIHAWIDGELSPEQATDLAEHASTCPECAARVAEARGLVAASTRILTALDDVPGSVIPSVPDIAPAQTIRRRWYQRTDLRAAAALLFVAGASMLVVRRGTDSAGSRAMLATVDKGQPTLAASAAASPVATAPSEAKASVDAQSSKIQARDEAQSLNADVARTRAAAPATLGAAVNKAVPTPPLRVVRADSTAGMKRTVYQTATGVEVTLTESPVETAAVTSQASGVEMLLSKSAAAVNSISWTERDRKYVLTGRLATKDLEVLKARLMQMRR